MRYSILTFATKEGSNQRLVRAVGTAGVVVLCKNPVLATYMFDSRALYTPVFFITNALLASCAIDRIIHFINANDIISVTCWPMSYTCIYYMINYHCRNASCWALHISSWVRHKLLSVNRRRIPDFFSLGLLFNHIGWDNDVIITAVMTSTAGWPVLSFQVDEPLINKE